MTDINELAKKLKENPEDYKTMEEYAIALSDSGQNEEALKYFKYLRKVFPENAQVYYNIGIIFEKLKYNNEASQAYEKALKLDENDIDIKFNLALVYIKNNNLSQAEKLLTDVLVKFIQNCKIINRQ